MQIRLDSNILYYTCPICDESRIKAHDFYCRDCSCDICWLPEIIKGDCYEKKEKC